MTVFENIDNEIARQKTSRRKVAIAAGIAPSTFQSLMERKRGMSFEKLQKIAAALNVSLDSLDPVTAAKKEAIDVLISKAATDKKNGKEWDMSAWSEVRNRQIKDTANKYSVDIRVLDKAVPTVESLYNLPLNMDTESVIEMSEHILRPCPSSVAFNIYESFPDDWRKDSAIQAELDILKEYLGDKYNDKIFHILLRLFPACGNDTEELVLRLKTLAYDPTEK